MAKKKNASSKRKTTTKKKAELKKAESFRVEITLWTVIAVALLLMVSNFGVGGAIGTVISRFLFGLFGVIAYVFPIVLIFGSFFAVSNKGNHFATIKLIAVIMFIMFLCMFTAMVASGSSVMKPLEAFLYSYEKKSGGGIIGGTLGYYLSEAFGVIGTYIIDIIVLIVCLVIITEKSAIKELKKGGQKVYVSAKENNERYQEYRKAKIKEKQLRMDKKVSGVAIGAKVVDRKPATMTDEINEIRVKDMFSLSEISDENKVTKLKSEPKMIGDFIRDEEVVSAKQMTSPIIKEKTTRKMHSSNTADEMEKAVGSVTNEIATEQEQNFKNYVFPPISLLKSTPNKRMGNTKNQLRETAQKLEHTLKTFGVNVTVTDISCGPAVTRFELQPEVGVKVSKIVNLADDIKLNLAAADIRIEAPIPGKAAVGIEVPNKENVMVSFRELIESNEFQNASSKISFAVGKDIGGKTTVTDIAKMPHVLIAGATGSGKSVCINTIIMSILYKAKPEEVKLIMIDPKVVELSVYNGIPHLMIPVVTDPKKAAGALHWAVTEMMERYDKFAKTGVREINGYNAKIDAMVVAEGQEQPKKLPQIVIIVDELADLMMVASNEVEEAICRLAQLARAAGIHLVIATQRPSVNVITGLIKANMPSRIAFAVTSGIDSRTILDMNGAEKLLGKGDMLFHPQGVPKPIRVQGAFVSDKEVADVVEYLTKMNGNAQYNADIQQKMENMENSASSNMVSISDTDAGNDGKDSYFMEAAKVIVDKERASIGMLQRYLKVGFNRAARIMDQLEEAGIVGPEEGTKPRKVLMSQEELESKYEFKEINE